MKLRQRGVSVLVVMMFSLFFIFDYPFFHSSTGVLSREDMETYAQVFLDSYNGELEDSFRQQFRKYFPLYSGHHLHINATISNIHGVALEFSPSNSQAFDFKTTDRQVESAVFKYVDLDITSVANSTGYKVVIYTGPARYDAFITITSFSHAFFSDTIFVTNKASFTKVAEGGELFLSNVIVDKIHFHALIMRRSNELDVWTAEQAKNDAHRFFENDLYRAFNQSEEVREYVAYPELRQLLEQIVWKYLHADEIGYDLFDFREDLAKVRDLARDKYHVSTEFVDELLDYLEKIATAPSPLPPWEVAPWSWMLGGSVSLALAVVARKVYKVWLAKRKKSKKKKRPRKNR